MEKNDHNFDGFKVACYIATAWESHLGAANSSTVLSRASGALDRRDEERTAWLDLLPTSYVRES